MPKKLSAMPSPAFAKRVIEVANKEGFDRVTFKPSGDVEIGRSKAAEEPERENLEPVTL